MGSAADTTFNYASTEHGGAVLKTSAGDAVIVALNGGDIEVWKDMDGTPTQVGSSQTPTTIHGNDATIRIHACIDSNDLVHLVSIPVNGSFTYARYVAYNTCHLTSGFGTWEEAAPNDGDCTEPGARIGVDSNDDVHIIYSLAVAYHGTDYRRVYYTNNVSGWLTPEKADGEDSNQYTYYPMDIALDGSDNVHIAYRSPSGVGYRARISGSWGTRTSDTVSAPTDIRIVHDGTNELIVCRSSQVNIYAGQSTSMADTTYDTYNTSGHCQLDLVLFDGTPYIIYIDSGSDVHAIYYDSGWVDYGDILVGTALDVQAVWQYNNGNQSGTDLEMCYCIGGGTGETWLTESLGLPPVNKDLQIDFDVLALVNKSLQIDFDLLNLVNKDTQAVFDIYNLVNKELQVDFDLFNLVNKELQIDFDMIAHINKDLQVDFDLFNLVNKDLQVDFDLFNLVSKDLQVDFDLRDTVNKELQLDFDMTALVNKDLQVDFDLFNAVYKEIQADWDMLLLVNKDLQADWDMRLLVNKDLQADFDMFNLVNKELQADFDILSLGAVNKDLQADFDILTIVNKELQVDFDMRSVVGKNLQMDFDMRTLVYVNLLLYFDIGAAEEGARGRGEFPVFFFNR